MKDNSITEGVNSYLENNDRKDKFQTYELSPFHFPCSECIHRHGDVEYCKDCRNYINWKGGAK